MQLDFILCLCLGCFQKLSSYELVMLDILLSQRSNISLSFQHAHISREHSGVHMKSNKYNVKELHCLVALGKEEY